MLATWSKFYFDFEVGQTNFYLAFDEGGPELNAEIRQGAYTLTDAMLEVAAAMSDAGGQAYTVVMDRSTRLVTISAPGAFDLLVATGTTADTSIFSTLGFTGADRTGASSYTGNLPCGKEYRPQFKLQDWIDPEHFKKSVDSTVRKAADGSVEVVTFGRESLIQANIRFATNLPQDGRVIRNNPTGVDDLIEFLLWGIRKTPFEIIPNEDLPTSFYKVILERTQESQTGVDYKLKELYDKGAPGYFETGVTLFRVIE